VVDCPWKLTLIATIATLAYLDLQIRGSVAATRAEARRSMDSDLNETIRRIGGDSELAQLFMLGLTRPPLTSCSPKHR
jgi:hypothetical protein